MLSNPSSLVLIVVNLLPVGGVLWFDWSVLEILLLYWTESVIIGAINVLRMLASRADNVLAGFRGRRGKVPPAMTSNRGGRLPMPRRGLKAFLVPFFIIHYGMFCYAHLTAVASIFRSVASMAACSTFCRPSRTACSGWLQPAYS